MAGPPVEVQVRVNVGVVAFSSEVNKGHHPKFFCV